MEPLRRRALIEATIAEVGAAGSLDVTVGQIARRAGMSSGLAHHYFGGKDQIFLAAMREILSRLKERVVANTGAAVSPRARLHAIVAANLEPENLAEDVVAAWLTFYLAALSNDEVHRLIQVYRRRLHSNLMHDLRDLTDVENAQNIARSIAAMIDGVYIQLAMDKGKFGAAEAITMIKTYLDTQVPLTPDMPR